MYFDFLAFIRCNFRAIFKTRGKPYRLTPKRFLFLVLWLIIYVLASIINHFFFLLDEVLFPKYHDQEIKQPVFIIGNPRSGTTFLHRLLYKDQSIFTSFTVWEMAFAPSITQRNVLWFFARAGRPIRRFIRSFNKVFRESKVSQTHAIRLTDAEEDEHIMIHCFASETLFNLYPFLDLVFPYFYFDRDIPKDKQRKMMRFYRNMIQRHLYAHGGEKVLLSKNPSYSSRIAALSETFPDAQFIKLVRNPFEAVPSMLNVMAIGLGIFCDPRNPYAYNEELMQLMTYYYFYPVEYFQNKKGKCQFIKYDDLVKHPDEVIKGLYTWMGRACSEDFEALVTQETQTQRHYHSKHHYPLGKMGLSEERIFKEFEEVFSYYEFQHHDFELPEREMTWQAKAWPKLWKIQRKEFRKTESTGENEMAF